jgi:tRNA modification GTPase
VDEAWNGSALAGRCASIAAPLRDWLTHLPAARRREQGVRVALVGRPNVGKSSLLNALVGFDRAIVSEVPGTTRDTVEESIWLDGVEIRLCDAAGVREPTDRLERLGLARTSDAARRADLAVLVLDRASGHEDEDRAALAMIGERPVVVAWNKADLAGDGSMPSKVPGAQLLAEVSTIAVRPGGAEPLRDALRSSLPRLSGAVPGDELPTTSARQEALLEQAVEALDRAETGLREDAPYDLIAVDLTDARRALGEIVGRGVDQDVIASIFAQFCIGK